MANRKQKIIVALGGASGSLYGKLLLDQLAAMPEQWEKVGVILSDNAKINWKLEIKVPLAPEAYPFDFYTKNDFMAPFASGSAQYNTMVVIPCSMGMLGRIAHGISNDLCTRAADVILKERRKLILVPRETPYNLLHIRHMQTVTEAGAIVAPASPSLYSDPKTIEAFCMTVVNRIIDLMGLTQESYRWGE